MLETDVMAPKNVPSRGEKGGSATSRSAPATGRHAAVFANNYNADDRRSRAEIPENSQPAFGSRSHGASNQGARVWIYSGDESTKSIPVVDECPRTERPSELRGARAQSMVKSQWVGRFDPAVYPSIISKLAHGCGTMATRQCRGAPRPIDF